MACRPSVALLRRRGEYANVERHLNLLANDGLESTSDEALDNIIGAAELEIAHDDRKHHLELKDG